MSLLQQLGIVVLGIAWLTAAATAIRFVSRIWLRHWVEQKLSGAMTPEAVLDRPQRLILSAGAGVSALALLGGTLIAAARPVPRDAAIGLALFALVTVILGQVIPRAIARRWPAALLPIVLPVLRGVDLIVAPVRWMARPIARRLGAPRAESEPAESIEDVLREGQLEGLGDRGEIAIITGVVHFGDKVVANVMTPRQEIFAFDAGMPTEEQARVIASSGYSRVPVYRGSIDNVVGMIHAFDLLKLGGDAAPPLRTVETTSATSPCNELLFRMLRSGRHLAIVQGENRSTLGLVTLEDLLEELVGDIRDEHDEPAQSRPSTAA